MPPASTKKKEGQGFIAPGRIAPQIIKLLEQNTASCGKRISEVLDDWIELVEATLRMQPRHLFWMRTVGIPAPDPDDVRELWSRLKQTYAGYKSDPRPAFDNFTKAMALLMQMASLGDWEDVVGAVYMEVGSPSQWHGQFFTPFPVSAMMARMLFEDRFIVEVYARIRAAIEQCPEAQEVIAAADQAATLAGEDEWFWHEVMPIIINQVEPFTMSDPCCGSGVMMLAYASVWPRWMVDWGLVQFFGQDIDATCVKMASVNFMLFGLNGYGIRVKAAKGETLRPAETIDWQALLGWSLESVEADSALLELPAAVAVEEPVALSAAAAAVEEPAALLAAAAAVEEPAALPAAAVDIEEPAVLLAPNNVPVQLGMALIETGAVRQAA